MSYFGLTGGIASGKSTVAGKLHDLGARIIDADRIGHEMLRPTGPANAEIVREFGSGILDARGEIDRQRLGRIVFSDTAKLGLLNRIVHPRIIARVEELAAQYHAEDPGSVIVVDAALIFEAGIGGRFAKVIVAWCRPEQQIERLMAKTRISRQEAEQRLAVQMPVEEKRRRADYVIDCSGSLEETRQQVGQVYRELVRQAGRTRSVKQPGGEG
jgi:dephospho-CoA kinase